MSRVQHAGEGSRYDAIMLKKLTSVSNNAHVHLHTTLEIGWVWSGVGEQRPQRQTPEWKSLGLGRSMAVASQSPCGKCAAKLHDAANNDDRFYQALLQNSSGMAPEHFDGQS